MQQTYLFHRRNQSYSSTDSSNFGLERFLRFLYNITLQIHISRLTFGCTFDDLSKPNILEARASGIFLYGVRRVMELAARLPFSDIPVIATASIFLSRTV